MASLDDVDMSAESFPKAENGAENVEEEPSRLEPMSEESGAAALVDMDDHHSEQEHDSGHGAPVFFADATLDLSEAHDIVETPEPKKLPLKMKTSVGVGMEMPSLGSPGNADATTLNTELSDSNKQLTNRKGDPSSSKRGMTRITSADVSQNRDAAPTMSSSQTAVRPKPPRRPRDIPWLVMWVLYVPLSLTWPLYPSPNLNADETMSHNNWFWVATSTHARTAIGCCIALAFGATVILARLLYRTMGGGDGDDARHVASQVLLAFAPLSVLIHPLLILAIYLQTPSAIGFAIIPLFFLIRDVLALRQWRRLQTSPNSSSSGGGARDGMWHDQGRQTFFQALTCMALDVLSRSLRRLSFYRYVSVILGLQLVVVWLWCKVILRAIASELGGVLGVLLVFVALLGGKWATGTVARILGLIASGGIASWFAQQSALMDEMDRMKASQNEGPSTTAADDGDTASDDYNVGYSTDDDRASRAVSRAALNSIPEAYQTAEASAYQSVLDMDEGMDDDFEDEACDDSFSITNRMGGGPTRSGGTSAAGSGVGGSTVKAFLFSALTVSFGSVAQCGLLGGVAQFVWSVVRNVEATTNALTRRFASSGRFGFRGMQIGGGASSRVDGNSLWLKLANEANVIARSFVRSHSDLALSHVAAYYKSYQRAANDVAALVDAAGVETIIHDDISTHMCDCVCGSLSGIIVILVGYILSHHRSISDSNQLSDTAVVESMLLSFVLCYTLLFTVMEPLRASIKAIYVCFAQHPQSLSQAFPLIFHRLSRISEANLV